MLEKLTFEDILKINEVLERGDTVCIACKGGWEKRGGLIVKVIPKETPQVDIWACVGWDIGHELRKGEG
jgi:hypothetical protein